MTAMEKKLVGGFLAIWLGCFGVHKFYLGYKTEGMIMLLISVLSCFMLSGVVAVIGIIEGIIYLCKDNDEFHKTYIENKKGWF
ncbi:MAG TPA: hypothetical protein DCZ94_09630 [Lentisphaeria bacterium]|nr:hypothetical protein [Lentisphaeria bacterium]